MFLPRCVAMASATEQQMLAVMRAEELRVGDRSSAAYKELVSRFRAMPGKGRQDLLYWHVKENLGNQGA